MKPAPGKHERPCCNPDYQLQTLDGEIIIFHPASQKILYSNFSGALIWHLCDGRRTVADITELLSAAYPDADPDLQRDVCDTLLAFAEQGAIEWL